VFCVVWRRIIHNLSATNASFRRYLAVVPGPVIDRADAWRVYTRKKLISYAPFCTYRDNECRPQTPAIQRLRFPSAMRDCVAINSYQHERRWTRSLLMISIKTLSAVYMCIYIYTHIYIYIYIYIYIFLLQMSRAFLVHPVVSRIGISCARFFIYTSR